MGRKKKGGAVLKVVIKTAEVRVRKAHAPPSRPMQDRRLKERGTRRDFLAEIDQ